MPIGSKFDEPVIGATPDIAATSSQALTAAHWATLQKKLARQPEKKGELEPIIEGLKKQLNRPAAGG